MVSEDLVQRWEAAYQRYGEASKVSVATVVGDQGVAREMVVASHEVATAWRSLESTPDLPWWALAAVAAAAEAFEFQAQEWMIRAESLVGPVRRMPTRPRPTPHRRSGRVGGQR